MDNAEVIEATEQHGEKKKSKKDKVRSAWISFAGRIVAQLVGAIATVALGVMVLHRYTSRDAPPPPAHAGPVASVAAGQPVVHVVVLTPAMLGLRDADQRAWPADSSCTPSLDSAGASAAHVDTSALLSR